jgi:hypothetical protein
MAYLVGQGHMHFGPGTSMVQMTKPVFGMGSCCGSCAKGGTCKGMGLFDSGFDVSGWGWQEWGLVIFGGYALTSVLFTTKRAASRVASLPGERRKRKAARLRSRASELVKKR